MNLFDEWQAIYTNKIQINFQVGFQNKVDEIAAMKYTDNEGQN